MSTRETGKAGKLRVERKSKQNISAMAYAWIAGIGLVMGIGLLLFYVYAVPGLMANNQIQKQVFYVVLIPWGLSAAAFLFGTMRSYARYSNTTFGKIELAGPVVLFCLVVLGGFKLIPPEPFDVTVRPFCQDTNCPQITSGMITLEYGHTSRDEEVGPHGEANFKGIPGDFKDKVVNIVPRIDGYVQERKEFKVQELVVLPLKRIRTHLRGSVAPSTIDRAGMHFFVEGAPAEVKWDERGDFDIFPVYGTHEVRLKICASSNLEFDDYKAPEQYAQIHLNKVPPYEYEGICGSAQ